jgi:hypothetical protein
MLSLLSIGFRRNQAFSFDAASIRHFDTGWLACPCEGSKPPDPKLFGLYHEQAASAATSGIDCSARSNVLFKADIIGESSVWYELVQDPGLLIGSLRLQHKQPP